VSRGTDGARSAPSKNAVRTVVKSWTLPFLLESMTSCHVGRDGARSAPYKNAVRTVVKPYTLPFLLESITSCHVGRTVRGAHPTRTLCT